MDNEGGRFWVGMTASNKFNVIGRNAAGAQKLYMRSDTAFTASATWHHVAASWDLATAAGFVYVDGAANLGATKTLANANLDYSRVGWAVGAQQDLLYKWNGVLSDLWCNIGNQATNYMDLSVAANLAKLVTPQIKPVDLGSDGSTPTTVAPLLFMKFADGALTTNSGSGANFTSAGSPASAIGPITPRQARVRH
jgi:hypothetical protein